MADHVARPPRLGLRVLITESWYYKTTPDITLAELQARPPKSPLRPKEPEGKLGGARWPSRSPNGDRIAPLLRQAEQSEQQVVIFGDEIAIGGEEAADQRALAVAIGGPAAVMGEQRPDQRGGGEIDRIAGIMISVRPPRRS